MTAKLTYHSDQIIYVIYIKIFYSVTDSRSPSTNHPNFQLQHIITKKIK